MTAERDTSRNEYFDRYVFECFGSCPPAELESRRESLADGVKKIRWVVRDEWDRRIYGFEINNKPMTDRWAWAFVVERDGALEIEEFYVRPEFRRRGYTARLSEEILALGKAKRKPLRLWVPFADSQQESPANIPRWLPSQGGSDCTTSHVPCIGLHISRRTSSLAVTFQSNRRRFLHDPDAPAEILWRRLLLLEFNWVVLLRYGKRPRLRSRSYRLPNSRFTSRNRP